MNNHEQLIENLIDAAQAVQSYDDEQFHSSMSNRGDLSNDVEKAKAALLQRQQSDEKEAGRFRKALKNISRFYEPSTVFLQIYADNVLNGMSLDEAESDNNTRLKEGRNECN